MIRKHWAGAACSLLALAAASGAARAAAYPAMAPPDQYMIANQSQEIALARSAAPPSISEHATVMVLGPHGYVSVAKGANGFVCFVERSWDQDFENPEFWNPKIRSPNCINAAAVRTVLPAMLERAKWALSGLSLEAMKERDKTSAAAHMTPAAGSVSFMMSKDQYLNDGAGDWHPHLMFYAPRIDPSAWGANLQASPILASTNFLSSTKSVPVTVFMIPVRKWSDGTLANY
ncbi:MAG: hypothetical protein ACRED9_12390 [Caulobacteraceae bacterium]